MKHSKILLIVFLSVFFLTTWNVFSAKAQWVTRDHRWHLRGPWNWTLLHEHPELFREFNGIDFGHARIAETLIETQDPVDIEKARLEVLDFIDSSPSVAPDEAQMAPTFTAMVWEIQKTFNWAHTFHRSLYDLFSSDRVKDKDSAYRKILDDYLMMPEAITPHRLDHHGKLWSFPESKSFRDKYPKFNSQIWAYHWLQGAVYDVQLMGDADEQRELMPRIIEHYHNYLRNPPLEWQFMPMMYETAPEFSSQYPQAAAIFDNLHMLHDNVDDVLSRPDLYPTLESKREAILKRHEAYLNRNHESQPERYADYHESSTGHDGHGMTHTEHGAGMMDMGPRPPSAEKVLLEMDGTNKPQESEEEPAQHHHEHD